MGHNITRKFFSDFAREWDFIHDTSSPHFAQSNGNAERMVQTCKNMLKKSFDSNEDYRKALLVYRSTPLACGKTPTQLLMGRNVRSNLPFTRTAL